MFRLFHVLCCVLSLAIGMSGCSNPKTWSTGIEGACKYHRTPGPKGMKSEEPTPRGGAAVKLKALDSDTTLYECTTDVDGAYRMEARPGKYRLVAELPDKP